MICSGNRLIQYLKETKVSRNTNYDGIFKLDVFSYIHEMSLSSSNINQHLVHSINLKINEKSCYTFLLIAQKKEKIQFYLDIIHNIDGHTPVYLGKKEKIKFYLDIIHI